MAEPDPTRAHLRSAAELRVVAHPTRLRIIGLLRRLGPQTGAMLGAELGESAGTVSYHLRSLADAGLVAETDSPRGEGADRRERWWRAAQERTVWDPAEALDDPERAGATSALMHAVGREYAARWSAYVAELPRLPREWVAAAQTTDDQLRLTVTELAALRDEISELMGRWRGVSAAHEPGDGSEPVALVAQAYRMPGS
jgi:DNA-binding transcriptional ArsR family regulator